MARVQGCARYPAEQSLLVRIILCGCGSTVTSVKLQKVLCKTDSGRKAQVLPTLRRRTVSAIRCCAIFPNPVRGGLSQTCLGLCVPLQSCLNLAKVRDLDGSAGAVTGSLERSAVARPKLSRSGLVPEPRSNLAGLSDVNLVTSGGSGSLNGAYAEEPDTRP